MKLQHPSDDRIVLHIANPHDFATWENLYHFRFGAYGTTHVLVYAHGLEDGLEEAAGWLETNAPGHLVTIGRDEFEASRRELAEEMNVPAEDVSDEDIQQHAEADLTYTESGYLVSHEWYANDASPDVEKACYAECAGMYAEETIEHA